MDSNQQDISPKYLMELISEVEKKLLSMWEESKYKNVHYYILKWHEEYEDFNQGENFHIYYQNDNIDLNTTLHRMPGDILMKIAIDLGINTPGYLPSIPLFKNDLKNLNKNAYSAYENAFKALHENPDEAVSLANSVLESILKTILIEIGVDKEEIQRLNHIKLMQKVLKEYKFLHSESSDITEVRDIASALMNIANNIEDLRSAKTKAHGRAADDYLVDDPLWAVFTINVVTTLGLFLNDYKNKKYKSVEDTEKTESVEYNALPF